LAILFGPELSSLGTTVPGPRIDGLQAAALELLFTCGLVATILGTASRAQNLGPISAAGVAGYIVLAGLWPSPVSGASMNPASSFGPDLVLGDFSHFWISCSVRSWAPPPRSCSQAASRTGPARSRGFASCPGPARTQMTDWADPGARLARLAPSVGAHTVANGMREVKNPGSELPKHG
jgi:major intrinsic protein